MRSAPPPPSAVAADANTVRDILRSRAQALARVPAAVASGELLEMVEFMLGREHYAFELRWVREVANLPPVTPLPCVPAYVLGLINLHGQILSVIDIKRFFDLPQQGIANLNRVIVLRNHTMVFGVLADDILGVRRVERGAIHGAPANERQGAYLMGVTRERLLVLDAKKILCDPALRVDQDADHGVAQG
ncbi:purine-binding chemotaxis protein CheW [Oxalobacteraceae bacterium GrIS 1.11]